MIYVDNSILKDVAACTLKAVMRHVYGLTSEETSAPLMCGTAFHTAMECWFKQQRELVVLNENDEEEVEEFTTPLACALAAFEYSYREWSDENLDAGDKRSWENVSCILEAWLQTHPVGDFPFRPIEGGTELGFARPLVKGITFTGRLDLLAETINDRALCFTDHKTTGWLTSVYVDGYHHDTQFSGYWDSLQDPNTVLISEGVPEHIHALIGKPVSSGYVNCIELKQLPGSDRKCATHGMPYPECKGHHAKTEIFQVLRSEQQLRDWRMSAIRLAKRFKMLKERYEGEDTFHLTTLPQEGMFNGGCDFCTFKDWCSVGRPEDVIKSVFRINFWAPFDYAKTGEVKG